MWWTQEDNLGMGVSTATVGWPRYPQL